MSPFPFTLVLLLALTAVAVTPGAPVLAGVVLAAVLALRLVTRHHVRLPRRHRHPQRV